MASNYTCNDVNPASDPFSMAEIAIKTTFSFLIQKLNEKMEKLLKEVSDLKFDYFSREEIRKKEIIELDKLIEKMEETTIEQNTIVKLHEDHIKNLKEKRTDYQQPTPIPFPEFSTVRLQELQLQLECFGKLQDIGDVYRSKHEPIASIGEEKVDLYGPRSVVTDEEGKVYVVEAWNCRIQVISLKNECITEFGNKVLSVPNSIALYKNKAFVSDRKENVILIFDIKFIFDIQTFEFVGKSENLGLSIPLGLTVGNSEVLVADSSNNRIVVLSIDLKFLREFGTGKLNSPVDVKVNRDKIFVADESRPENIHIFSPSGDLLNCIISLRDGTGYIFFCFDQFNNILISDSLGKSVQIFTTGGQLVHSIECDYEPNGIAVTRDNIIICVDSTNNKIDLY